MRNSFCVLFLLISSFACAQQSATVDFYLTPSVSESIIQKNGSVIRDFLQKETGINIRFTIPESYDAMVENFGSAVPCFALMSGQSYIKANEKYGAIVKLRAVRFGHSVYYGMIVTRATSGITKIKDLEGKTIAYTDELSTSGYLYPKKLLEKNKVKPSKEIFAKKHDEVVKLVYEGKADAGAAFFSPPAADGTLRDARARLIDKYSDVEKKVIIIIKTDPIPNDPVVFSKNFNPEQAQKLSLALMKLSKDEKGKQALAELYGSEGFVKASDADYNSLRQVMVVAQK